MNSLVGKTDFILFMSADLAMIRNIICLCFEKPSNVSENRIIDHILCQAWMKIQIKQFQEEE